MPRLSSSLCPWADSRIAESEREALKYRADTIIAAYAELLPGTNVADLLRSFSDSGWRGAVRLSERNGRLVRAGPRARLAHLVHVTTAAATIDVVGIGAIVSGRRDHRTIAVDVHVGASRTAPGQVCLLQASHLVAGSAPGRFSAGYRRCVPFPNGNSYAGARP